MRPHCKSLSLLEKLLIIALLAFPFGTSMQNFSFGLLTLVGLILAVRTRTRLPPMTWPERLPMIFAFSLVTWHIISSMINPKNPFSSYAAYFLGYAPVFVLPFLVRWQKVDGRKVFNIFEAWLPFLLTAWFLIALSQNLFGWSMSRSFGEWQNYRPHGLYSHPLSFAYAALLFWPYCIVKVLSNWRLYPSWLALISIGGILLLTNSRTAIGAATLVLAWILVRRLRGKLLLAASMVAILAAAVIASTDNPVSNKISATLTATDPDRFSDYPDDRLAFWHAHWKMFEERPVLGHGAHLNTAYRLPYYEMIDLADFEKKYSAHNQYIQVLANGGLPSLILLLTFFSSILYLIWHKLGQNRDAVWLAPTIGLFMLAIITQNAYDDSVVRYTFSVILVWLYCLTATTHDKPV